MGEMRKKGLLLVLALAGLLAIIGYVVTKKGRRSVADDENLYRLKTLRQQQREDAMLDAENLYQLERLRKEALNKAL